MGLEFNELLTGHEVVCDHASGSDVGDRVWAHLRNKGCHVEVREEHYEDTDIVRHQMQIHLT